VALYGGFAGAEFLRSERSIAANVTTLSGDLNGDDASTGKSENSYHVVTGVTGATLDGFTVTGGNANASGLSFGGGMCNILSSSPTVSNCILWGDAAALSSIEF
jgi:hypothetical protein